MGQLELEQKKSDDLENKFEELKKQVEKKAEELKQQVEEQKEDASSKEKQFEDLTSKQNLFEQNTNKKLSELVPLLSRVKQVEQTVDSKVSSLREEFTTFDTNQADRDTKNERRFNDVEKLLDVEKLQDGWISKRLVRHVTRLDKHDSNLRDHAEAWKKHDTRLGKHDLLFRDHAKDLRAHAEALNKHDTRLGEHGTHLRTHAEALNKHDTRLGEHDTRLGNHDLVLTTHAKDLKAHAKDLNKHELRLGTHDVDLTAHAEELKKHDTLLDEHDHRFKKFDDEAVRQKKIEKKKIARQKKIEKQERIRRLAEAKHIREVIILYHTEEEMNNDYMEAIIDEIKVDQANQDDENYRNILGGANIQTKIQTKIFNPQSSDNLPIYDPSQHSGVVYIYVPNSAGLERVDKIPGLEENSNPANRDRFKEWQNQLFLLIPTGKVSLQKDWRPVLNSSTHSCYGVFDLKNIGHILYLKNKERANVYKGVFDPRTTLLIGKDSLSQTDDETINVNIGTKQRLTDFFRGNAISLGVSEDSSTSSDSEFEDSESESESRERDPVPNTHRKKLFGFI